MRIAAPAALAALTWLSLAGCPMNGTTPPTTGDLNLTSGFGTATRTGTTSGVDDSPSCAGFFPTTASHTMTLNSAMTGLTVSVASNEADVVLLITFGGSSFCAGADDPAIQRGSWSAGTYEIFVGTSTASQDVSYTLTVTEP